jgi:RimJ/RimL family protein N-acetyltransferase
MITWDTDACRTWLEDRIQFKTHPETVFMGWENGGKLETVIGFSHYVRDTDIEVSVASEANHGGVRGLIAAFLQYVFEQANCRRCTVRVRPSNTAAVALATRMGFQQEGCLRHGFGDEDALVFGLLREQISWRQPAIPQAHQTPTRS